jgi:O-antigen/teichoic acid export membrane protein
MPPKQLTVRERLIRGGGGSLVVNIMSAGTALIAQKILIWVMGIEQYGIYATAFAALSVLVFFCRLGMDAALVRYVAVYIDLQRWSLLRGIMFRSNLRWARPASP